MIEDVAPVALVAPVSEPSLRADPPTVKLPAGRRAARPEPTPRPARVPRAPSQVRQPRAPRQVREPRPQVRRQLSSEDNRLITLTGTQGWLVLLLLGVSGVAAVRLAPGLPHLIRDVSAVAISASLAWALAVRTGGRVVWATGLATVLGAAAVATESHRLLAGVAIGTGVLAGTLAVMSTVPAATFARAIREVVVAALFAWTGALGVVGYGHVTATEIDLNRFGYTVLSLSLIGAFALVYRLGAGLHGLGRRGYVVAGGAVVMLVLALAYSAAVAHWGSRELVTTGDHLRDWTRTTLGAVPHPIVALLGYPALLWGVFMRARRRQGWWVTAFGVAATAPTTTRLVAADTGFESVVLGAVYSLVIGVAIGYLVIRIEQSFTGSHGRRARRHEEAEAHRPEPGRLSPLH